MREIGADISVGARDHALVFEARVGDKQIEGCDFIQLDEAGATLPLDVPLWIIQRDERGGTAWFESCVRVIP